MKPPRGYESLRRYRTTIPGASYFVTVCTQSRLAGLNECAPAETISRELHALATDGSIEPRAWVIMPDHLHLFFSATGKLALGQVIGRLKVKTRRSLAEQGLMWQGKYYEHRLRPSDAAEDVLRYLHLNPYRAGLISPSESYPYFWLGADDSEWFRPLLVDDRPFPEWLV